MKIRTLSDAEIKRELGIEFVVTRNLSQFGGLQPFLKFLEKVRIKERLTSCCGADKASALLQLMFGLLVGSTSMESVAEVCKDPAFKSFIKRPLSATQLTRTFKKITAAEISSLHELTTALGIMEFAETSYRGLTVTLDIDATAVEKYGKQEGVAAGYIGKDEIKPCYQYLFVRNSNLHSFVYGTIREGSTHSQNGFIEYLKMLLPMFNGEWSLRLRADSGYFNEAAFSMCSAQNVEYFIKAPMIDSRQRVADLDSTQWEQDTDDPDVQYASIQTNTKEGYIWREIFKRVRDKDSKDLLFPSYKTYCLATNNLDLRACRAYEIYNGRANIENNIREMKNDYGLGKIVTESFQVNDAITQATLILYILVGHFKRHCLDKDDQSMQLSTVRRKFFHLPARFMSSSRYEWSRICSVALDKLKWNRIISRVLALRSILTIPLPLQTG